MEQQLELRKGYTGADKRTHRDVVVGRLVTGEDLMKISDQPESAKQTQFDLMILQTAITSFGELKMPVPLTVLLSLNSADRRDLAAAYARLIKAASKGRTAEKLSKKSQEGRYKLAFGFRKDDTVYDVVEFGKLLSGYEELEADEFSGVRRTCYVIGQQIVKLSQFDGPATLDGPVPLEMFGTLVDQDLFALQEYSDDWVDSFRGKGGAPAADVDRRGGVSEASSQQRDGE